MKSILLFRPNPTGRTGLPHNALLAIDGQEDSFAKESAELPDIVIIILLKREHLLTRAKLNALYYEHITGERKLRSLKTQLRQVQQPASAFKVTICIQCWSMIAKASSQHQYARYDSLCCVTTPVCLQARDAAANPTKQLGWN